MAQLEDFLSLHEDLKSVLVFDLGVAGWDHRIALEVGGEFLFEQRVEIVRELHGPRFIGSAKGEFDEMGIGRIFEEFADAEFIAVKFLDVVIRATLYGRVICELRLDDHFAFDGSATRSAGNLHEELEDIFRGAKVGDTERSIGV